jgi:hypothetical protein
MNEWRIVVWTGSMAQVIECLLASARPWVQIPEQPALESWRTPWWLYKDTKIKFTISINRKKLESIWMYSFLFFFLVVVLECELRTLHLLDKCFYQFEPHPKSYLLWFILQVGCHFAQGQPQTTSASPLARIIDIYHHPGSFVKIGSC